MQSSARIVILLLARMFFIMAQQLQLAQFQEQYKGTGKKAS